MLEIYLTRHGETEWNTVRRMQGQGDSPLTELGIRQAEWLGHRLKGKTFICIYTSPLGRARETAEILNKTLQTTIIEDKRLMEIFLGDWEGRLLEDIDKDHPEENKAFWKNPVEFTMVDKEDFDDVRKRASEFFETLLQKHGSGKVLVVAHAIVLKGMLNYIQGKTLEDYWTGKHLLPTSLTKINVIDNRYSLIYTGETDHHEEVMSEGWFIDE